MNREEVEKMAEEIYTYRGLRGWSQGEFAKRAGVARNAVINIEGGLFKRLPHASTIAKIRYFLDNNR